VDQVAPFNVDANAPAGVDPVFDLNGDGTLDAPPPGSTAAAGTYTPPQGYIASGRLQFDTNGQLLNFVRDGQAAPATPTTNLDIVVPFTAATGVAQQQIDFDISAVTQFSIPSTLRSVTADGSVPGDLTGVSVSPSGVLSAQFSNGQTEELFLIPTATFLNPNALQPERGSTFRLTPESGLFTLNTPGEGGSGVIQSNAVETSNVDLGTEFANLIVTQRAYTASSQIIQTADELLQELINIPN
jgi:flagellar hook protein FlgE